MKKISFDFLATMPLKEIEKTPSSLTAGKSPVQGADFRLFADGSIYPSADRIQKDQLEFKKKDSGEPEFGYDVFNSTNWSQYSGTVNFPCIAKVSKHLPKVDLFSRTKYNPDGTPKSTITNLMTKSGLDLIKILEDAYCELGESLFPNGVTYVDLRIVESTPLKTQTNIYNIPKLVARGVEKGKAVYERRENITIYPLEIVQEVSTVTPPVKSKEPVPANQQVPKEVAAKLFA